MPRNLLNNRTALRHQKAVDSTNGMIMGYARWLLPESIALVDGVFAWPEAMVPAVPAEEEAEIRRIAEGADWKPDGSRDDEAFEELMGSTKQRLLAAKPYLCRLAFFWVFLSFLFLASSIELFSNSFDLSQCWIIWQFILIIRVEALQRHWWRVDWRRRESWAWMCLFLLFPLVWAFTNVRASVLLNKLAPSIELMTLIRLSIRSILWSMKLDGVGELFLSLSMGSSSGPNRCGPPGPFQ